MPVSAHAEKAYLMLHHVRTFSPDIDASGYYADPVGRRSEPAAVQGSLLRLQSVWSQRCIGQGGRRVGGGRPIAGYLRAPGPRDARRAETENGLA
ncbi:hypothetical protein CERSUDRAFT_67249 [Gelatoporia subvermispora B]|uniref:Uncharacterized protein n=1 Tax=Ceriporiopsis subvermispora (strain B) TaxID=914234 RepID=M2R841_CERS8|nr:hypothetical protein CERSUDRAFT_67249 [Gelatoporia subvermispora B]